MSQAKRIHAILCQTIYSAGVALALAACGGGEPTAAVEGALQVSVELRGNSTDADGVLVTATPQGGAARSSATVRAGSSGTLDVPPGEYSLSLTGLAEQCWADQDTATVSVVANGQTQATFRVTCVGDLATSRNEVVTYLDRKGRHVDHQYPGPTAVLSWNPQGTAVLVEESSSAKCTVSRFDVGTGIVEPVGASNFSYDWPQPVWSPTGDRLALSRRSGCQAQLAAQAIVLYDGTGQVVLDSIPDVWPGGMAWRPGTDQLTYTDDTGTRLHSWADGVDTLFSASSGQTMAWSPDGTLLAMETNTTEGQQIMVLDAYGQELFAVGGTDYAAVDPKWAPDGSGFLFEAARPGEAGDIYYVAADGSGERRITLFDGPDGSPDWAPDGSYFAYARQDDTGYIGVFLGSIGSFLPREIVAATATLPKFNPNAALGLGSP